ncbi:MAG: leucine-rich repeat protein [Paludibacteraceae bacterium]|nr:leucine-rich repeat protein [Paludibacteraceae bacterium]
MFKKLLILFLLQCAITTTFATNYLTFTAEEEGSSFGIENHGDNNPDVQYSLDDGETWTQLLNEEMVTLGHKGDKALLKGENPDGFDQNDVYYTKFQMRGTIAASGSVMSLIDGIGESVIIPNESCFYRLFSGCTSLTQAPELPATTLTYKCYYNMFVNCSNLTEAPDLPATTLAKMCYDEMFRNCSSLTQAPELPATVLAYSCYSRMFSGCTSLTQAPELPATTLSYGCYSEMFENCTNLTQAPQLPAITLADYCYSAMFKNCTSLTQAPELPSTNMTWCCYRRMFEGCTNLTKAPVLHGTVIYADFAAYMFKGCKSLSEISISFSQWYGIGATGLQYDGTENWVSGVAPTGTFICPKELPEEYGDSKIPEGWKIEYKEAGIEETASSPSWSVRTSDLILFVSGAKADIEVYDSTGKLVARRNGGEDVQVELPQKGVFFVKVGKECRKVEL